MASHVSFEHISLTVGDRQILRDISFSVEEGESITIIGPSGSGKSTILKLASSLVSPTGGTISLVSLSKAMRRRSIANEWRTVFSNLIYLDKPCGAI